MEESNVLPESECKDLKRVIIHHPMTAPISLPENTYQPPLQQPEPQSIGHIITSALDKSVTIQLSNHLLTLKDLTSQVTAVFPVSSEALCIQAQFIILIGSIKRRYIYSTPDIETSTSYSDTFPLSGNVLSSNQQDFCFEENVNP